MARRRGKLGEWLVADQDTGFTVYSSKIRRDYLGALVVSPTERNLQEIASPLNDPQPVAFYRGPNYEQVANIATLVSAPTNVGVTNVPTNRMAAAIQAGVVK